MRHQKANDFVASPRATWLHDFSAERGAAGSNYSVSRKAAGIHLWLKNGLRGELHFGLAKSFLHDKKTYVPTIDATPPAAELLPVRTAWGG